MTDLEIPVKQLGGVTRQLTAQEAKRPRPLPWLGKRLLALAIASGTVGYAFHLFGTWPLGIIAIATPICGWTAFVISMQRTFGPSRIDVRPTYPLGSSNAVKRELQRLRDEAETWRRYGH